MPHDKNGHVLNEGDLVSIPARVTSVMSTDGDAWSNVIVETVEPMYPGDTKTTISLNAKQVEKAPAVDEKAPADEAPAVAPAPSAAE